MSESTLLVVFISFIAILLILIVVLRKISVRDIFDDDDAGSFSAQIFSLPKNKGAEVNELKPLGSVEKKLVFSRENIYKISKVVGIIGAIILFTPTPDSFKSYGIGIVSLGWILSKISAPSKQAKISPQKNSTSENIRTLAGKPEYQAALKLLYADYSKNPQASEEVQYRRAVEYLRSKGIPLVEAKRNLKNLLTLLIREKRKNS